MKNKNISKTTINCGKKLPTRNNHVPQLNRKGFFEDVAELFMASIALIVLGVILIVIFNASTAEKKDQLTKEISFLESNYDTTLLLKHEVKPGYTLSELIVDVVNNDQSYTIIDDAIEKMMKEHYDPDDKQSWIFQIKAPQKADHNYAHNAPDYPAAAMSLIDGTIIPNPDGGNIRVIFKEVSPNDRLFEKSSQDEFIG